MVAITPLAIPTSTPALPVALPGTGTSGRPVPAAWPVQSPPVGWQRSERSKASWTMGRVVAAAVAAAALVAALWFLAASPAVDASYSPRVVGTHVVEAGETMWSIALVHAPAGEAAGYVERLVDHNGTAVVVPGQLIELPAG